MIILTALGVDLDSNKDVLAIRACAEGCKDGWLRLLQEMKNSYDSRQKPEER